MKKAAANLREFSPIRGRGNLQWTSTPAEKWRNCAVRENWHGPCKQSGIRHKGCHPVQRGNDMTKISQLSSHLIAAASALALSLVLITGTVMPVGSPMQAHT